MRRRPATPRVVAKGSHQFNENAWLRVTSFWKVACKHGLPPSLYAAPTQVPAVVCLLGWLA